jgi:hypothetical protein
MTEEQRALVMAAALEVALDTLAKRPPCPERLVEAFQVAGVDLAGIEAERAACADKLHRLTERKPPLKPHLVAIEGLK